MINRARQVVVMLFLSALAASCAQGASVLPATGDAGGFGNAPVCGNGKLEGTELCECEAGAQVSCVVHDKTCTDLGMGTGALLCVPSMCVYDDTMCSSHAQGTAGTTAQGAAGSTAGNGG